MKEIIFEVTYASKSESREVKGKETDSSCFSLIDSKKKPKNNNDWTPTNSMSINLIDGVDAGLSFGKKYKVIFEEVK